MATKFNTGHRSLIDQQLLRLGVCVDVTRHWRGECAHNANVCECTCTWSMCVVKVFTVATSDHTPHLYVVGKNFHSSDHTHLNWVCGRHCENVYHAHVNRVCGRYYENVYQPRANRVCGRYYENVYQPRANGVCVCVCACDNATDVCECTCTWSICVVTVCTVATSDHTPHLHVGGKNFHSSDHTHVNRVCGRYYENVYQPRANGV